MEVVWCLYEGCMVVLKVNFRTCARYSSTGARVPIQEPARAGNRCYECLSALRAHTKAPYKMDFHRKNAKER
jgi:hypothetical protein